MGLRWRGRWTNTYWAGTRFGLTHDVLIRRKPCEGLLYLGAECRERDPLRYRGFSSVDLGPSIIGAAYEQPDTNDRRLFFFHPRNTLPRYEIGGLDALINPSLIMKMLSNSTEAYDRCGKLTHYKSVLNFAE